MNELDTLQRELDTLRSQRRDALTLALCSGYERDARLVGRARLRPRDVVLAALLLWAASRA